MRLGLTIADNGIEDCGANEIANLAVGRLAMMEQFFAAIASSASAPTPAGTDHTGMRISVYLRAGGVACMGNVIRQVGLFGDPL